MAKRKAKSAKRGADGGDRSRVPIASVFDEVGEVPPRVPSPQARQPIAGIFGEVPTFRERPTFHEWFGAILASRLLWFICGLALAFVAGWWWTRPTLAEIQSLLGSSADPKEVVDTLEKLQSNHFDHFRGIFQLVVLSGLVPLFTLLAGYAFGSRARQEGTNPGEES